MAKISGGITFDVAEIESFSAEVLPAKNGMPKITAKARRDVQRTHAAFCRALQGVGLYEEFITPLSAMMERFKEI